MTDIVIGDDHTAFAEALAEVLDDVTRRVVAVENTTTGVLEAVRSTTPDLCLLDRWFDDGDALDVLGDLHAACRHVKVVVFTADPDRDVAHEALERGADGFVHKTRGTSALFGALDRTLAGETVVELPPRWQRPDRHDRTDRSRPAAHLTAREKQCLALLVHGASTPEIAARLGIGITTVRTHVQGIMTKVGVHTRLEASAYAVRHGLVDAPQRDSRRA
ncbi:response regulator transcription factor [Actinomycetospora lutea]|uniref:response regulator n=1 Tax=Actinomycetospora lutea TaxID=663604 RepID=UPI0023671650|nr:response regulator transcription factor [Actinomycetospora lutea]MDD7941992.1 response regulator transcription factor [Actinomycetospora lutea]